MFAKVREGARRSAKVREAAFNSELHKYSLRSVRERIDGEGSGREGQRGRVGNEEWVERRR
jgi:hypothetical protein